MIDKEKLKSVIDAAIVDTAMYITDLKVAADNSIVVEVDSDESMDIEACTTISRAIEAAFDRDVEDYELEVGSPGITSPFKVRRQYQRNVGNDIEVLTKDGRKLHGVLSEVLAGDDDTLVDFVLETQVKVKEEGCKKPIVKAVTEQINSNDCKYVRYDLKF